MSRVAHTDTLEGWMRDINTRLVRMERKRQYIGATGAFPRTLVSVDDEASLPWTLRPDTGYYRADTGTVWMLRDGVLTDQDNDGVTITLEKFFES